MQRFDSSTCIRKRTKTGYADSEFLKALNDKENFHTYQVSACCLCFSLKGIASKVQNYPHSTKPNCAEVCEY